MRAAQAEIRAIVKRRTHFEFKLRSRVHNKEDFLRYIEYELNLDALRRKRHGRLGVCVAYADMTLSVGSPRRRLTLRPVQEVFGQRLRRHQARAFHLHARAAQVQRCAFSHEARLAADGCARRQQDVGLWLQFIDFCLKTKASLSKIMPK